jgi:CRISPR/Cas system Type II protein with McrA/HNH and RuvC-like nuclease domain
MRKRILGLDTGTNSLGWAVLDRDDKQQLSTNYNEVISYFKKV